MSLHGIHRELNAIGDFLGTVTPGDKLQDLTLPRRKVVGLGLLAPDPLHLALHPLLRYARAEIGFALRHRLQRKLQFSGRGILAHVASGARAQRLEHVFLVGVHGKHHHAHLRKLLLEQRARLESPEPGHGNVEQHDIRAMLARKLQYFAAVACFGHDRDPYQTLQERAYSGAHQGVIIREKDAHRGHTCSAPARTRGSVRLNRVSRESAESIASRPPASVARSSMLSSPMLVPAVARSRAAATSKPRPLSRTPSRNSSSVPASVTQTSLACAWRAILVSASC